MVRTNSISCWPECRRRSGSRQGDRAALWRSRSMGMVATVISIPYQRCNVGGRRVVAQRRVCRCAPSGSHELLELWQPGAPGHHVVSLGGRSMASPKPVRTFGTFRSLAGMSVLYNETDGRSYSSPPRCLVWSGSSTRRIGCFGRVVPGTKRSRHHPVARGSPVPDARRERVSEGESTVVVQGNTSGFRVFRARALPPASCSCCWPLADGSCSSRRTTAAEGGLAVTLAECSVPERGAWPATSLFRASRWAVTITLRCGRGACLVKRPHAVIVVSVARGGRQPGADDVGVGRGSGACPAPNRRRAAAVRRRLGSVVGSRSTCSSRVAGTRRDRPYRSRHFEDPAA